MRKYMTAMMALFVLAAIAITNATAISATEQTSQPILKIMQAETPANGTLEGQSEMRVWNNFVENFNYEGVILNGTLRGNTTYEYAMIATTAVLVMNSQALADSERMIPEDKYKDFHNYTINAMKYFNVYLYNTAKYFQTRQGRYYAIGRDALNQSSDYYNKGKNEAEFIF